jgi:hypothetical protein
MAADDRIPLGADPDHFADRIDASLAEQRLEWRLAEHDHVLPILHLGAGEEAPRGQIEHRADREVLRRAEDDERTRPLLAVKDALLRRRSEAARAELNVDELDARGVFFDGAGVGDRQVGPLHQLVEDVAAGEAARAEPLHKNQVWTDRADRRAQRLVEAANHRGHADDRGDADDDAEDGERRAQLVAAHGVERHDDDFGQEAGSHYSFLNASIGSSRAARDAGYRPKNNPTTAVIPMPTATDHSSTDAEIGEN